MIIYMAHHEKRLSRNLENVLLTKLDIYTTIPLDFIKDILGLRGFRLTFVLEATQQPYNNGYLISTTNNICPVSFSVIKNINQLSLVDAYRRANINVSDRQKYPP
jgi:hypothetical protein